MIQANGGTETCGGGGGAVAIEYGQVSGTVLNTDHALGGTSNYVIRAGGAGTIYTFEFGVSTYGDLLLHNGYWAGGDTRLPALGGGTAAAGSGGAWLVTDLATAIQPYFTGHWVEVMDSTGATVKGIWRIVAIETDGVTEALESNQQHGEPSVAVGDLWQGVYIFDRVTVQGGASLVSDDPVLESGKTIESGSGSW